MASPLQKAPIDRWFKADLQIAGPIGRAGYSIPGSNLGTTEGRRVAATKFVEDIAGVGIEVFALASHNTIDMASEVREAAGLAGLVMFPGMELSTGSGADGVHLILVGDPSADIVELESKWMAAAGFGDDHPPFDEDGSHLPAPRSLIEILDKLPKATIAIAPHVFNNNGLMNQKSIGEKSLRWRALHHDRLEAVDVGVSTGIGFNSEFRARTLKNFPALDRMAFVATSDAYKREGLGRHTWIRMHKPNLECMHQALLDYGARVIRDEDLPLGRFDPNHTAHSYLRRLRIEGASTSEIPLEVEFGPNLNVIIGGRGAGKSTVVQALRAAVGGSGSLPDVVAKESRRFVEGVFCGAQIQVDYVEALSGELGEATWTASEGTKWRGASPPLVRVVSQKELFERTSDESERGDNASANMIALVDEALEDDRVSVEMSARSIDVSATRRESFTTKVATASRAYTQAAAAYLDAADVAAKRAKVETDLAELTRKLSALDDAETKSELEAADATLEDERAVSDYIAETAAYESDLGAVTAPAAPQLKTTTALHAVQRVVEAVLETQMSVAEGVAALSNEREALEKSLAGKKVEFAKAAKAAAETKADYEKKLSEMGVDLSQYGTLQAEQRRLQGELKTVEKAESSVERLARLADAAWSDLDACYAMRFDVRQAFVAMVAERTESLRFAVSRFADASAWRELVHSTLSLRQSDHIDAIDALARWLWEDTDDLAERASRLDSWRRALMSGDFTNITIEGLTASFRNRISASLQAVRLEIAASRPEDGFEILFLRDGADPINDASWQSVTAGSPGQRSAAMLAFTLSFGDSPLVLDQPEDDLDSELVSRLIVARFRSVRWKRQLIVVTHEANIPVNADAERIVVLENRSRSLRIVRSDGQEHTGPLDNPLVREDIQTLLEGGVSAFINRERRYDNELSKYRQDRALMKSASAHGKGVEVESVPE